MDVFELLTTQTILDYSESVTPVFNAFTGLFPEIKTDEEQLIITDNQVDYSESAQPVADNTEAPLAQRPGITKSIQDIATFKLAYRLTDTQLRKLRQASGQLAQDRALQSVFDDVTRLIRAHEIVNERMRAQAMTEGKIDFKGENNFSPEPVDFGIPKDQFKNFDFEKGDFLEFLYQAQKVIRERTGYNIVRMILSSDIEFKLRQNESVRSAFASYQTDFNRTLTNAELAQVIQDNTGIAYSIPTTANNEVYGYNSSKDPKKRTITPFIPVDKCILLPGGDLGNTVFGVTTEELELMARPDIDVQKFGNTIITTGFENNPVNQEIISVSRSTVTYPKAPCSLVMTDQESGPTTFKG